MEKEKFKVLLIDLYTIYNPANIQYVDELVEKYNRLEFDSLKNIFIKYNRKSAPYYDSNVGTDEHIHRLIKEYNSGSRTLQDFKLQSKIPEQPETIEKSVVLEGLKEIQDAQNEMKKEVSGQMSKQIGDVISDFESKIKEIENALKEKETLFKQLIEKTYKEFEKKTHSFSEKIKDDDDIVVRMFSTSSNSELDLPNKKIISKLGKGTRLILKDSDGKIIGMEIVDITYDGVSYVDGKPLVEVFLEKI
ncbi:MAG: hypothetical protein WC466_06895 [Candidatus Izemoplasmatales bacterium]